MRSGGSHAADWAVITERLQGHGKHHGSNFSAIHKVLPVFEYLFDQLEKLAEPHAKVDFDAHDEAPDGRYFSYLCVFLANLCAPYDLHINLRAAWNKANEHYNKLDDSHVYYAATCLHPYYRYYCENALEHKIVWLRKADDGFQELWRSYKKPAPRPPPKLARTGDNDDVIGALTARRKCARGENIG
jgi:hypothetical protein